MPQPQPLAFAAALAGCLLLVAAAPAPPSKAPTPLRKLVATVDEDPLPAGKTGRIVVTVTLSPEFHVNSHTPSQDYLIATSIETTAADGLEVGGWKYPEGETKRFAYSEEPIQVYEGSFRVEGTIKAPATLSPSRRDLRLLLKYQACTIDRCYPPKKEPITLSVRVDAASGKSSATPGTPR
ncbi:MAG TPA: protein-disulfide reductase DsbD domain-containing protein [Candidatus Polarisedimenticolia bacterium]|nr:protein-disulfide reductase DsbD domain-containing protein [Candidatus Polarisedimenticolia bacterium]